MSAPIDTLWYTRCPIPTSSVIAVSRGMLDAEFAPDGIEVLSLSAAPQAAHQSHFDHTWNNSFRDGGNIPPIWARSRGADTTVVALTWIAQFDTLVTMPGSGIVTVADLRGRRVAIPRRTNDLIDFTRASAEATLAQALAAGGLGPDDIVRVDLAVDESYLVPGSSGRRSQLFGHEMMWRLHAAEVFALIRGEVDVIYLRGGHGIQLRALLGAVEIDGVPRWSDDPRTVNNSTPAVLTASGELVRQRPELVARYLATLMRAAAWAGSNEAEARALLATEVGTGVEWFASVYADDLVERLWPSDDPALIDALRRQKDFLHGAGFLDEDFPLDEWIDVAPLRMARELMVRA